MIYPYDMYHIDTSCTRMIWFDMHKYPYILYTCIIPSMNYDTRIYYNIFMSSK